MVEGIIFILIGIILMICRKGVVNYWIGYNDFLGIFNSERKKRFATIAPLGAGLLFIIMGIASIIS